jgi:hypothetical protein
MDLMMVKMSRTRMGARPRDGSSNMISLGMDIRPRPMASICCSPPERVPDCWRRRSLRRGNREKTNSLLSSRFFLASPRRDPISRFSSTVISTNNRRASGTWARPSSMSR